MQFWDYKCTLGVSFSMSGDIMKQIPFMSKKSQKQPFQAQKLSFWPKNGCFEVILSYEYVVYDITITIYLFP